MNLTYASYTALMYKFVSLQRNDGSEVGIHIRKYEERAVRQTLSVAEAKHGFELELKQTISPLCDQSNSLYD